MCKKSIIILIGVCFFDSAVFCRENDELDFGSPIHKTGKRGWSFVRGSAEEMNSPEADETDVDTSLDEFRPYKRRRLSEEFEEDTTVHDSSSEQNWTFLDSVTSIDRSNEDDSEEMNSPEVDEESDWENFSQTEDEVSLDLNGTF